MQQQEVLYIRLATGNDYVVLDNAIHRIMSAAQAEYAGVIVTDAGEHPPFNVIISDRSWPSHVSDIHVNPLQGITTIEVSSLPPKEREEDDDIAFGYEFRMEREPGLRRWQVIASTVRQVAL